MSVSSTTTSVSPPSRAGLTQRTVCAVIPVDLETDRVLMITSRKHDTKWIFPKGGHEADLGESLAEAAVRESWEEAGTPRSIATTSFTPEVYAASSMSGDGSRRIDYHIFEIAIKPADLCSDWPEAAERKRQWVTVAQALERCQAWANEKNTKTDLYMGFKQCQIYLRHLVRQARLCAVVPFHHETRRVLMISERPPRRRQPSQTSSHEPRLEWTFPKGANESLLGESCQDSAYRESWEEAGTPRDPTTCTLTPLWQGAASVVSHFSLENDNAVDGETPANPEWHVFRLDVEPDQLATHWPGSDRQREWVSIPDCLARLKSQLGSTHSTTADPLYEAVAELDRQFTTTKPDGTIPDPS